MAKGGHKSAKKFAPKLKAVIKKRHVDKKKRVGMKQKEEHKEKMKHKREVEDMEKKKKYNPQTDFDLGFDKKRKHRENAQPEAGPAEEPEQPKEKRVHRDGKHEEKREMDEHKAQLEQMKLKDPEFFKFLEDNDRNLLEFGSDDEGAAEDEQELEDDEDTSAGPLTLTVEMLKSWEKDVQKNHTLKTTKRLVIAYRVACHTGDDEMLTEDGAPAAPFRIVDSTVFNHLMMFCLRHMHELFDAILQRSADDKKSASTLPSESKKWKSVGPIVRSYIGSSLHFLQQLTHATMIGLVLRQIEKLAPYYAVFPQSSKKLLKAVLHLWSTGEHSVRLLSYLCVRKLAEQLPFPFIENVMKGIYLSFLRSAKFVSVTSLPILTFLSNCVCDLYSLDLTSAYQHAFIYIRQLAIHLRAALNTNTKDAVSQVYNWQYVNCLKLWGQFLAQHATKDEIRPLVYPFVHIVLGVMRVQPGPKHFPLRFICARVLTQLAASASVYIPLAPFLLEVFESAIFQKKLKSNVSKPKNIETLLKVSNAELPTRSFQEKAVDTALLLLAEHFAAYAESVSFPELVLPAVVTMRKFVKTCKIGRISKQVMQLVKKLEENSSYIAKLRSSSDFAPKDTLDTNAFSTAVHRKGIKAPLVVYTQQLLKADAALQKQLRSEGSDADDDSGDESPVVSDAGEADSSSEDSDSSVDSELQVKEKDNEAEEEEKWMSKAALKRKRKVAKSKSTSYVQALDRDADTGDIVDDYEMSDSD
eukprot:TRINITY_DN15267_c0_g1_i1.p1 TRINITY_DN15267_c0_g1~~TRINITY_DN15267_c0_g1_i1.p1  ORF type:complete len:774 (-),score=218.96 TRINITY_DN15267_c0_g1_i1:75-2333(-)